ncbi:hypothetical protein GCM10009754_60670 [Amycolatopsis minnesotensis]|uniref:Uncharacterized protein n=1 Tax=Amycolatopsis minnesotensis TaxID=337894 RepID=A0ABN2RXN2_9PSEU
MLRAARAENAEGDALKVLLRADAGISQLALSFPRSCPEKRAFLGVNATDAAHGPALLRTACPEGALAGN